MFQFAGFASLTYGFSQGSSDRTGFPHSEICGSKPARGSPQLIAACYVLHRLSEPRHPRNALLALDLSMRRDKPGACTLYPRSQSFTDEAAKDAIVIRKNLFTMTNSLGPALTSGPHAGKKSRRCLDDARMTNASARIRSLRPTTRSQPRRRSIERLSPRHAVFIMVEPIGIEPTTSSLQSSRSPN